jgi:YidC/Oxa1 family membrane protein insertase
VEQRRLLLAFGLSVLLLIAYQELVLKRFQRPTPQTAPPQPAAPAASAPADTAVTQGLAAPSEGGDVVRIDTDLLHATISTVGGRLTALELKQFRKSVDPGSPPLELIPPGNLLPGTLQLGEEASDAGVVYTPSRRDLELRQDERGEIVFAGEGPNGLTLEKRYVFTGDAYLVEIEASLKGAKTPRAVGLILTPMPAVSTERVHEMAIALDGGRLVQHQTSQLLDKPQTFEAPAWAGFATQYFVSVAMSDGVSSHAIMTSIDGTPLVRVDVPVESSRVGFVLYTGPKDRDVLTRSGHDLQRALDFGWFWFVAIPLLQALKLLNRVTGNYGIAIIVLTAMVKAATIPLTRATFRNMREMQKIQPQMAKLRERFKDDAAELQKEMMELYRRHRVNPLSGCLPLVLQMPVFIGLYNALSGAIELRHAPFALWIRDLSAPEWLSIGGISVPVLTILMGISMFVQQWLTPQQGDPAQQRAMMIMPVVFTFMFINFPAGLVLYWLVNNVLTIGQQYVMLRSAT